MKAIILNAGEEQALKHLIGNKPKCLLEIEGTSLLEVQINTLYQCGIEDVIVVRGYGKEHIQIPGIKYYDNDEYKETGTLYSLMKAIDELDDDVCIIYGDIICEADVIKRVAEAKGDITAGVIVKYKEMLPNVSDWSEKELLTIDADNQITHIGKHLNAEEGSALFAGILKCSKNGSRILANNYQRMQQVQAGNQYLDQNKIKSVWLVDFLNELAFSGVAIQASLVEGAWREVDTEEDYKALQSDYEFLKDVLAVKTDWDERSKTYDQIKWVNNDKTINIMIDFAGDTKNKKMLDLGTGTGKVIKSFYHADPTLVCHGIDISKGMMGNIGEEYPFELYEGVVEDLHMFEDESLDLITARMVLHHSSDLKKVFEEVHRVLKKGGKFIVCEGTPPSKECLSFYEEMFRYKEDRHTFLMDDLMNLYANAQFNNITARIAVLDNMSLDNWLQNAGVPFRNVDIIRRMHFECDDIVKEAYNMKEVDGDLLMMWKFAITCGEK